MEEKHLYRFGTFTLNPEENVLSRDNEVVSLTPKMFEMLHVLIRNHGQVVDKDTLFREVWPDSFVEEGNISFNIRQLRKLLDDDAQSPIYIETVPRRGYRFIAKVEEHVPAAEPQEILQIEKPAAPRSRSFLIPAVAAVLFLVGASVFAAWFLGNSRGESIPLLSTPFASEKLSNDGQVYHAVMSSDGKKMVYTRRDGVGKQSVWLRQFESGDNTQIVPPTDHFYGGLALSPDGNTIYFVRGSQSGPMTDIYRMPILGGVPQKISEGTQGWISISPDGMRMSFVRCAYTDEDYCSLYVADTANGGNEKKLVSRPRPIRIADNKISPDGKTVAFGVGQSRTSSNDFSLMAVDIETTAEREITPEKFFVTGYISWLPDASGLIFTARRVPDQYSRIWKVTTATGEAAMLTTDSVSYSRLSMDEKGTKLVSTEVEADFRLYQHRMNEPDATPRELASALSVTFAPDGKLLFSSMMTGDSEIWIANPDGSDPRQLTNDPTIDVAPIVSPDGKFVFFESDRAGVISVWRMNIDGTDQKQITSQEGGFPLRVSPDGQWLYYRSGLKYSLRRVPTTGGAEELVLNEMGRNLTISPDTTLVAFSERKGQEIIVTIYSITEQKAVRTFTIGQPGTNLYHLTWSDKGDYVAYILTDDKRENAKLFFQTIDDRPPRQVADLKGDTIAEVSALALSPDGKSFVVIKGNWKHDAVLIKGLK